MLELAKIRLDGGTQQRAALNEATVADYAEAMQAGASFPPVTVFYDGVDYWLADGFHRYFGAKKAGFAQIAEDVHPGTVRDAILYSLGANGKHGLRRTNADKRKAVTTLLSDAEWAKWTQQKIADACGVSREYVGRVQSDLSCDRSQDSARTVARNGTTYEMDTARIGRVASKLKTDTKARFAKAEKPSAYALPQEEFHASHDDDYAPSQEEIDEAMADDAQYQAALRRIFESDDRAKAADDEIKKLRFQVEGLKARERGLQNELAAAKRQVRYWKDRAEKAERFQA